MKLNKYDFAAASIFILSFYLKLNKLNLVEYKYDQQFGFNVLKNCSEYNFFSYIKGSTGIPQGALHYIFECLGGILGINNFINLVKFEIFISQLSLFFIYLLLSKNFNKFIGLSSISLVLLNPYLIIATRNISSAEHFEFFLLIYLYLFFNLKRFKYGMFLFSLFSSISLIVYFPVFIYFSTFLIVIYFLDKTRNTFQYIFGYLAGLVINFVSYFPYFNDYGIPTTRNTSSSWGISSYWRIYLDILSSSSITSKVNNQNDFENLLSTYPYFDALILINKIIVLGLLILFTVNYVKKIFKHSIEIDIDLLTFISLTLSGVVFTLLDRPLYAHYFFTISIFGYISFINIIPKRLIIGIVCIVFNISNILIYSDFISFVETNNGIQRSDYGKVYSECGCCVDDARQCRGQ